LAWLRFSPLLLFTLQFCKVIISPFGWTFQVNLPFSSFLSPDGIAKRVRAEHPLAVFPKTEHLFHGKLGV